MIELENTYLIKELPNDLMNCEHKEIIDVYLPVSSNHPVIRLRKNGDKFELTKKYPVSDGDASEQIEETIILDEEEFDVFSKLEGKRVSKVRYYFDYNGRTAEIDVFKDGFEGLVVVDFEFDKIEDKNNFEMPDFCLCDITQESFIAGGMLAGKSYLDIEKNLARFNYIKQK